MASVFQAAADQEISAQPWYVRFKGSLLIVASGVVWILQELVTSPDIQSVGWGGALGVIATVAAFFLNRFTRDGITPSMAKRLEHAGMQAFLDRPSESGVEVQKPVGAIYDAPHFSEGNVELPVYRGDSTAGG